MDWLTRAMRRPARHLRVSSARSEAGLAKIWLAAGLAAVVGAGAVGVSLSQDSERTVPFVGPPVETTMTPAVPTSTPPPLAPTTSTPATEAPSDVAIEAQLSVGGSAKVEGQMRVAGVISAEQGLAVQGTSTVAGDSLVTGNASVSGDSVVAGNASVAAGLTSGSIATGNITSSSLAVAGDTSVTGDVLINGASKISGDSVVSGNSNVAGSHSVTGLLTAGSLSAGSLTSGILTVNAPTSVGLTDTLLEVKVGATQKFRVDAAGNIHANNLFVNSAITGTDATQNNLTVLHSTKLNSLIAGATTVTSLEVSGDNTVIGSLNATTLFGNGAGLSSLSAGNISTGTLTDARLSANVTLQGNAFNGAGQLVKLTSAGWLPVLDGSNLTNLNATLFAGQVPGYFTSAANISTGTLGDARLSANVSLQGNTFNGASQLVRLTSGGLLPVLDGSNLTNLSAANCTGCVDLQVATPGTQQTGHLSLSGSGLFGGNVGIGTTAPGGRLHVLTTAAQVGSVIQGAATQTADLQQWQNSSGTALTFIDAAGNLRMRGQGSISAVDSGASYKGISVSSNQYVNTAGNNTVIDLTRPSWSFNLQHGTAGDTFVVNRTPAGQSPTTQYVDLFKVMGNGNVGIGTTTPTAKLHVSNGSSAAMLKVGDVGGWGSSIVFPSNGVTLSDSGLTLAATSHAVRSEIYRPITSAMIFQSTADAELARITNTGNFGIGTAAPTFKLEVQGTALIAGELQANHGFGISLRNDSSYGLRLGTALDTNLYRSAAGVLKTDGALHVVGATVVAPGTVAAPGIAVTGDLGTGIHSPGAGILSLVSGGAERLRVASGGNVGIGTSPRAKLEVGGSANPSMYLSSNYVVPSTNIWSIPAIGTLDLSSNGLSGENASPEWALRFGAGFGDEFVLQRAATPGGARTSHLKVSNTGNVGIGTTAPSTALHVVGTTTTSGLSVPSSGGSPFTITSTGTNTFAIQSTSVNQARINFNYSSANPFSFNGAIDILGYDTSSSFAALRVTNSSAASLLYVRNDGNVGLGTASPGQRLEVNGGVKLTAGNGTLTGSGNDWFLNQSHLDVYYGLWVRSTAPSVRLHGIDAPSNARLALYANGSEGLSVLNSGNVGIGTVTPANKLTVDGGHISILNTTTTTGRLLFHAPGEVDVDAIYDWGTNRLATDARFGVLNGTAVAPGLFNGADEDTGIYWPATDQVALSTGGTERLRVDASGNVAVGTTAAGARMQINTVAGTVGQVIRGAASQTADLFQAQDSTSAVLAKIDASGNLTVKAATINGNITVNGHIVTGNASGSTTAAAGAGAGTGPVVTIIGNDTAGKVTITTGTSPAAGTLATVTFANAFTSAPFVSLTPVGNDSVTIQPNVGTLANTSFSVDSASAPAANTTYTYIYHAFQ